MPDDPRNRVHTKIVATLGPASADIEILRRLCAAGVDVFRLNFSHGSLDEHAAVHERLRLALQDSGRAGAVLGDLSGPKIRLGTIQDDAMPVADGDEIVFERNNTVGADHRVGTNYDRFIDEVDVGQKVLVDDGLVRFQVVDKRPDEIVCRCTAAGVLKTRKGVNLPQTKLSVGSLTEHDRNCVAWAAEHELDYLALSFVRASADLHDLRKLARSQGTGAHLIAKIEKPEAIEDIDDIIEAADGLMIARGDLGVEMDLAQVPVIQKDLIRRCRERFKPVIVATQMLQSMIVSPTPTRAEVSDVANAIFDGTDAIMLSGETAVGSFPVTSVRTMDHIALQTEDYLLRGPGAAETREPVVHGHDHYSAIAHGVGKMVTDVAARAVVVWSSSGTLARHVSKLHLSIPVIALGDDPAALRRMALYFGVIPKNLAYRTVDAMREVIDGSMRDRRFLDPGDRVLLVGGTQSADPHPATTIAIHTIGADNANT